MPHWGTSNEYSQHIFSWRNALSRAMKGPHEMIRLCHFRGSSGPFPFIYVLMTTRLYNFSSDMPDIFLKSLTLFLVFSDFPGVWHNCWNVHEIITNYLFKADRVKKYSHFTIAICTFNVYENTGMVRILCVCVCVCVCLMCVCLILYLHSVFFFTISWKTCS